MDSSTSTNIPMSAIQSYHFEERQLYARMVLALGMDAKRSMEVIAFWLWLEARGHMDVIHHVNSFDDHILQAIAKIGQTFVEALRVDLPHNHPSHWFREEAVHGIVYYLDRVCYKVLGDIRRKAEDEANLRDQMEMLVHKMSQTSLENCRISHQGTSVIDRPPNVQPYVQHGEGSSRGTREKKITSIPSIIEVERQVLSGYPFNLPMITVTRPFQQYYGGAHLDSVLSFGKNQHQHHYVPCAQENIPREERTLFATFSNGYPLTEDELYNFFMRNYGDVEAVNIQKPKGNKPPLFAHVSFYSLATVQRILNGNLKVKFMTGGKHLWARRFYPKKNEEKKDK